MYRIVRHQAFSETTFLWELEAPDVARAARPGQFVMLRLHEGGERIPLTIADFDRARGTITMVVQAVGKTTKEMARLYKEGDSILDFVGPLGVESHVGQIGHVVMVGGGLGVAPVFPQLRAFKQAGNRTTGIIGFRSKDLVFWEKEFGSWCDELIVCTDDGSYGRPGFVTAALKDVVERASKPDLVVAIGPLPMMRACVETTRPTGVKTVVSLNSIMVDGTGMCGSCRVTVDGKVQFACVDGPDFDGQKVDFPELMLRQQRFKSQESTATEDYNHVCNLEKKLFEEEKRNYKKLKELPPHATKMPERDAKERAANFLEVNLGYSMADALAEAERCIQCIKPTCIEGCPVSIDIPRFIRHLLVRDLEGALGTIYESNLFPSICGRVCPQESQCEAQCILTKKMESVAIGRLERFVGDNAPVPPVRVKSNGHSLGRVAVVGSGPAGLAAAGDLAQAGADVVVYEALHVIGGVLQYGIPSFRLPRPTIDREVKRLTQMGVKIETNKIIGKTFTIQQLLGEMKYDAVFVGTGAGFPTFLGIPGEFAGQVYSANEFLTRVNLMGGDRFPYQDTPVALGDSVVVIGAGNTAMDCLRVSKRLGAARVRCVYRRTESEAPARIEELRHAKEEGIEFHWLHAPSEIKVDEKGNVQAIVCQRMELGEPDASGRRSPKPIEGAFETLECQTVIYALGTKANPIISRATPELRLDRRGYIAVADEATQATNMPGVFAGGDIVTGGATVILALGAGRRAARGMVQYLKTRQWPPQLAEASLASAAAAIRTPKPQPALERAPVLPMAAAAPSVSVNAGAVASAPTMIPSALAPTLPPVAGPARTCNRCRRPLEGDEDYVCCAGASLMWQCGECQKVFEGFAFPYGLCPGCGGTLAIRRAPSGASSVALDAVRHAFEVELGGITLYERGASTSDSPEVAALFRKLADMEREHLATLIRRYHIDVPEPPSETVSPARVAVYAGVEPPGGDGEALLKLAVELEKKARAFFAEHVTQLTAGTPEHGLYRELEAEEKEHVELLQNALVRYRQGKPLLI